VNDVANRRNRRARILCVVGARPNFMKIAPIMRAFAARAAEFEATLVHTGQHYDVAMNERFFEQLRIPSPDVSLEVGSGSHAAQTAEIMKRFEPVLDTAAPDAVLVVGDVNSTIACALVAAKKGVKVVHVEAGLRSRDRNMPEEINRLLTDQLSDRLYVTEPAAIANLAAEGIDAEKVVFVGNVMIDSMFASLPHAVPARTTLEAAFAGNDDLRRTCERAGHAVLTLHRPSNVDDPVALRRLLETIAEIARELPVVFPLHPRTRNQIVAAGLAPLLESPGVVALPPLGYFEMLGLVKESKVVLTDSGGLQEETTALGVPCLTLRENTERPVTIEQGSNRLVGTNPAAIRERMAAVAAGALDGKSRPELWDGHAAERIVGDLGPWLGVRA
jgi:UDP-N-acetylglucosamine 2-epimerase (non-hydrolysing)